MKKAYKRAWLPLATCTLAGSALFASPTLAYAESKQGIAVILPDMVEFIPMAVAFIILLIILGKFGWPLFEEMLTKREQSIRDALEQSENARMDSERLLEEYKKELDEAKQTAAKIVADAKQTGEATKAALTEEAQREAEALIEKARSAIETEKKAAITQLQASVVDLSLSVSSRLIEHDLSDEEHRALIERYVREAGSFNDK